MIQPMTLVILDGWGIAEPGPGNAISQATTPAMRMLQAGFPHGQLSASGEAVGLPHGEDGNTETGHLNIGAGQIVYQDLPRINMAIADGSFFSNPAFGNAMAHVARNKSSLHLLGLIGAGGVHSDVGHLFALMRAVKARTITAPLFLHLITDGRDSPPKSALPFVANIQEHIESMKIGKIASVMGRYWAMDRDFRWERTAKAYVALTSGEGNIYGTAQDAIKVSYERNITDEFIEPSLMGDKDGKPFGLIGDNDAVIFYNFRIDRPRQLTKAFVLDRFEKQAQRTDFDPYAVKYFKKHIAPEPQPTIAFHRGEKLKNLYFVTMTRYEVNLPVEVAFPPQVVPMPLGRVVAERGLLQVRLAETEKERFVTYYFNGQREKPFDGEVHVIIPSPGVATYDLSPAMSTSQLTAAAIAAIQSNRFSLIIVNVACPDMVAHTGNIAATIRACEAADECVQKIFLASMGQRGVLFVTADHGNAEELINLSTNQVDTEHSTSTVPFIIASPTLQGRNVSLQQGILADIAPTILDLMGIEKPSTMSGRSLIPIL